MKLRKGDTVKVLRGVSRGKTGKILRVFPVTERITVEGINLRKKHVRAKRQGQKGQTIEFPAPMHVSKVALLCPKCNKPTRVGISQNTGEQKRRMCRKCHQVME